MIKSIEEILGKEKLLKRFKQVEDEMMSIQLENITKSNELDRRKAMLKEIELKMEYLKLFDFYIIKNLLDIEITNIEYSKVKNKFTIKNCPDANISELLQRGYLIDLLNEYVGPDTESYSINLKAAEKYLKRIITKGEYTDSRQGQRYKTLAIKKILNLIENKDLEVSAYKNRDTLTTDYSDRMDCFLKVLRKDGTKEEPATEKKNNFKVMKVGGALSDSDIELFYYLIGEIEEHKAECEIKFYKHDFIKAMGYSSKRGSKLENIALSLMNLNAQSIAILDERKDKVGKKLEKKDLRKIKGTQLIRADFEITDENVYIKFKSPFTKYFREQGQFGRLLKREIIVNCLYQKPRVIKIARELSRQIHITEQKNKKNITETEINFTTLMKNISEKEKFDKAKNQRDYLFKLNRDINEAIKYISTQNLKSKSNLKFDIIRPTVKEIENGKIKMYKSK